MKLRHPTTSALALIFASACSPMYVIRAGIAEASVEADDITGTWTATSMLLTQTAGPNATGNPVVDEGAVLTLVLNANGTYAFTFVSAPENEAEAGTYTVSGSTVTITRTGGTAESFGIERNVDTMTLTGDASSDFGSGTEEAASMVITLTR